MKTFAELKQMISTEYHKQKERISNPKQGDLSKLYIKIAREYHGLYGDHFGCFDNFFSALNKKIEKPATETKKPSVPIQGLLFNFT